MSPEENKTTEEINISEEKQENPDIRSSEKGTTAAVEEKIHEAEIQSDFSREQWILTHIGDENLMEYLRMEQKKEEEVRKAKEARQKRILSAFQLAISLAAVIIVMFLLRENPTVMVNILYIIAIIAALWIWKNPRS